MTKRTDGERKAFIDGVRSVARQIDEQMPSHIGAGSVKRYGCRAAGFGSFADGDR